MSSPRSNNIADLLLNGTKEELTQKLLELYSQSKIDIPNESFIARIQTLDMNYQSTAMPENADLLAQMNSMDAITKFNTLVNAELDNENFQSDERYVELFTAAGRRMLELGTIKADLKPQTVSQPFSSFSSEEKSDIVSYGRFFAPKDLRIDIALSAITVCLKDLWSAKQNGFERKAEQLTKQAMDALKTPTLEPSESKLRNN